MTTEWIDIASKGYPGREYEFPTERKVWVKLTYGEERLMKYHGYGIFAADFWSPTTDVIAWRLENDPPEDNQDGYKF